MVTSNGSIQPGWRSNYKGDYNYNKEARPISTSDLLTWSFQVARGMEYLANRKVNKNNTLIVLKKIFLFKMLKNEKI